MVVLLWWFWGARGLRWCCALIPGAAIAQAARFLPEFWTSWRGPSGSPKELMCCTDAYYTGLVALGGVEVMITYDMLATTCPPSMPPGDCDSIVSIKLDVSNGWPGG